MGWFKKKRKATIGYEFGTGTAWSDRAARRATTQFLLNIATSMRLGATLAEALADHAGASDRKSPGSLYKEQAGDIAENEEGHPQPRSGGLPRSRRSGKRGELLTLLGVLSGALAAYFILSLTGLFAQIAFGGLGGLFISGGYFSLIGAVLFAALSLYLLRTSLNAAGFSFSPIVIENGLTQALARRVYAQYRKGYTLGESLERKGVVLHANHMQASTLLEEGKPLESWRYLRASLDPETSPAQWVTVGYSISAFIIISLIGTFITVKILPKFVEIFTQLGAELPAITTNFINYSALIVNRSPIFMLIFFALVAGFVRRIPWYMGMLIVIPVMVFCGIIISSFLTAIFDDSIFTPDEELLGFAGLAITCLVLYIHALLPGRKRRLFQALDPFTYFEWILNRFSATRGREKKIFLSALAELDVFTLGPNELTAVVFAGAESFATKKRAKRFGKALEEGETLANILSDPGFHPMGETMGRRLASGLRGKRLNETAQRLLREETQRHKVARKVTMHIVGLVMLAGVAALTMVIGFAIYAPMFALPARVATGH